MKNRVVLKKHRMINRAMKNKASSGTAPYLQCSEQGQLTSVEICEVGRSKLFFQKYRKEGSRISPTKRIHRW
jgi:hypothetical protein